MIALGNFLFRYRNALFPLTCVLLFLPGPRLHPEPLLAAAIGAAITLSGQIVRALTIGLEYIVRGGRQGKVYADGLVIAGLYHHCRNPMYVGNVLIAAGLAVASNSWTTIVVAIPSVILAYSAIIAAEEKYLSEKFGDAYAEYRRDVPRWLPRTRGLAKTFADSDFHWRRVIVKEYGTAAGWIGVLCGVVLYNLWRGDLWELRRDQVFAIVWIVSVTFALWLLARVLKKTHFLEAD